MDIIDMIAHSSLSHMVKSRAIIAFYELAKVEAKVHRSSIEHVHFHEVGAVSVFHETPSSFRLNHSILRRSTPSLTQWE